MGLANWVSSNRGVRYAKFQLIRYFIDIDILSSFFIDVDGFKGVDILTIDTSLSRYRPGISVQEYKLELRFQRNRNLTKPSQTDQAPIWLTSQESITSRLVVVVACESAPKWLSVCFQECPLETYLVSIKRFKLALGGRRWESNQILLYSLMFKN